jgi:hypothetical protein
VVIARILGADDRDNIDQMAYLWWQIPFARASWPHDHALR